MRYSELVTSVNDAVDYYKKALVLVTFVTGTLSRKYRLNNSSLLNKAPRRKQRGIKSALQAAGLQPAFVPRDEELNPEEIKKGTLGKVRLNKFLHSKKLLAVLPIFQ